jgi:hypothetical protein
MLIKKLLALKCVYLELWSMHNQLGPEKAEHTRVDSGCNSSHYKENLYNAVIQSTYCFKEGTNLRIIFLVSSFCKQHPQNLVMIYTYFTVGKKR